jgi:hypothetical protein
MVVQNLGLRVGARQRRGSKWVRLLDACLRKSLVGSEGVDVDSSGSGGGNSTWR